MFIYFAARDPAVILSVRETPFTFLVVGVLKIPLVVMPVPGVVLPTEGVTRPFEKEVDGVLGKEKDGVVLPDSAGVVLPP